MHTNYLPSPTVALDGGAALANGDKTMFQPIHKDGKEIRTFSFFYTILDSFVQFEKFNFDSKLFPTRTISLYPCHVSKVRYAC